MIRTGLVSTLIFVVCQFGVAAQSGSAGAQSSQQKLVLSYFHDVLDRGKIDLVDNLFQPDCVLHFGSSDIKGIGEVQIMAERIRTTYSNMATEVHDIFESQDRVVVRVTHRAIGGGMWRSRMGTYDIKGKNISWDATVIFQIKSGKITEEWVNRDELGMLLTAGILKPN